MKIAVIASLLIVLQHLEVDGSPEEKRLYHFLFRNYTKEIRPAATPDDVVKIELALSLYNMVDMNERKQILTTNCELIQKWNDVSLRWHPPEFGNITYIYVPSSQIWLPDTVLYNSAQGSYNDDIINTNVKIDLNGHVTLLSHAVFHSACKVDVTYFPFDRQVCPLRFASWTYDSSQLDLWYSDINKERLLMGFAENGEYRLESLEGEKGMFSDPCCEAPLVSITFHLIFRRRPPFFLLTFVMPCLLINLIALLVFVVPADSGEKVTLGISTMLNMIVFLMNVREDLPPTEKTSLISMYYMACVTLVASATAMSVMVLNLHHRGHHGRRVPHLVRVLVLEMMAKVVFYSHHLDKEQACKVENQIFHACTRQAFSSAKGMDVPCFLKSRSQIIPQEQTSGKQEASLQGRDDGASGVASSELTRMWDSVSVVASRLDSIWHHLESRDLEGREREARERLVQEWKTVSRICDRFLLLIFSILTAIFTGCIIFSSPYFP